MMIVMKLSSFTIKGKEGSFNCIVNSLLLICEIKSNKYLLLNEISNLSSNPVEISNSVFCIYMY